MDGELKYIHVAWIPAIPAGMTSLNTLVYNDERARAGDRYLIAKYNKTCQFGRIQPVNVKFDWI